jgi:hypothetical protein
VFVDQGGGYAPYGRFSHPDLEVAEVDVIGKFHL